ncbi:hypothetical protein Trydic_g15606 [Trypoxylus dichotomus]
MTSKYKVGLIVGHGLDDMDIIRNPMPRPVTTIFGDPSNLLIECMINGMECAIMPRCPESPYIPPNLINYRANVWALKEAGCTHVIDIVTSGSLKEEIKPGSFLMPDNFIDFTNGRSHTFFDGKSGSLPGALLCPMDPPFCEPLRKFLLDAFNKADINCSDGGVGVTVNGPRFSTKSESLMYQKLGGDFVNMVLSSDSILCKEAGMLYACIAFITAYDSWKDGNKYNAKVIKKVKATHKATIEKLINACVGQIGTRDWDKEIEDLKKETSQGSKCICKK